MCRASESRSLSPSVRRLIAGLPALVAGGLLSLSPAYAQEATGDSLSVLRTVGVQDVDGNMLLQFGADERLQCADFTKADPPTLTLMCEGLTMGSVPPVQDVGNGVVERIEISESSDVEGTSTQIKVLLTSMLEYEKVTEDNELSITLFRPGAREDASREDAIAAAMEDESIEPATPSEEAIDLSIPSTRTGELSSVAGDHAFASGGLQVRGVDFQNLLGEGLSRVVITGDRPLSYSTRFPNDRQIVVALDNASLGTGLERRLDTSKFPSAVASVASYRSRSVSGEVKVVVDLAEAVQPTFTEIDSALIIDFPIPASVAGASYDAPVTSESYMVEEDEPEVAEDDALESVTGRERLISGGASLDPAAAAKRRHRSVFGSEDGMFLGEINPAHQWRGRPINLNLVNANIHNVFRLLQAVSKVNIVASDEVSGTVTVQFHEVPWDQAFAAILQAKSLGAVEFGNVVRVADIETIRREREAAAAAKTAKIDSMPLGVLTQPLNYATAEDVMKQLDDMLSRRGSIAFDERTNALIIRDIDTNLQQMRELVRALDTQTPQVLIEARIVEASATFSRSLGIQWGGNLNFSPATGAPTGIFFPNTVGLSGGQTANTVLPGGTSTVGGRSTNFTSMPNYVVDLPGSSTAGSMGLSLGSITGLAQLDLRLTAGENNGSGRVVAAPSITTVTNRPAVIRDGARIPYETASLRGTTIQFVEATLSLEVTPQITQDNNIFLDIAITKNQPDFGATVRQFPSIQIKEAATTVMVGDGDTTVIGGVYTFEQAVSKSYLPGLGEIPVLGWLFKTVSRRTERKEMLVFITPSIVRNERGM